MLVRIVKRSTIILFFLWIPFNSMAWGLLGHRIIGQIADGYLTSEAKKEIEKILGHESIAMASNWPDFIKSDTNYNYLSSWHYTNFPGGKTEADLKAFLDADTSSAYARINFLAKELKNKNLAMDKKVMYLRLLIHIVGDIHQPLHVGRYEDLGGNKIKVNWMGASTNLHSLWDSQLINFQQLSYMEYAAAVNDITKAERKEWYKEPVSTWFWQSYQMAEKIYGDIKEPEQKLDYKYNFNYLDILNHQLLRGGVHLAGLLNEIFD